MQVIYIKIFILNSLLKKKQDIKIFIKIFCRRKIYFTFVSEQFRAFSPLFN